MSAHLNQHFPRFPRSLKQQGLASAASSPFPSLEIPQPPIPTSTADGAPPSSSLDMLLALERAKAVQQAAAAAAAAAASSSSPSPTGAAAALKAFTELQSMKIFFAKTTM